MNTFYAIICLACNARPNARPLRSNSHAGFPTTVLHVMQDLTPAHRQASYVGFLL